MNSHQDYRDVAARATLLITEFEDLIFKNFGRMQVSYDIPDTGMTLYRTPKGIYLSQDSNEVLLRDASVQRKTVVLPHLPAFYNHMQQTRDNLIREVGSSLAVFEKYLSTLPRAHDEPPSLPG